MNKIIIVDMGFLAFRSIHAFRASMNVPAGYTYLRMLIANLKRIGIDYEDTIILAKDSPMGSWRRDIVPEYKANRKENREKQENNDWWHEMFREIDDMNNKIVMAFPYHLVTLPKVEADDIASVACRAFPDKEVVLISSDSDWTMLLAYPNVKVMSIITKKYKEIENPAKVLHDKIMKGDVADNLIGKPKTEIDLEKRRKVVNLLELPQDIETAIKWQLYNLPKKNLNYDKIPFRSIKNDVYKLYEGGKNGQ